MSANSVSPIMFAELGPVPGKRAVVGPYTVLDLCEDGKVHSLPTFPGDPEAIITMDCRCHRCGRPLDESLLAEHCHPLMRPVTSMMHGVRMQWMEVSTDRDGNVSWVLCIYALDRVVDHRRHPTETLKPGALALIRPTRGRKSYTVEGPYSFSPKQYTKSLDEVIEQVVAAIAPDLGR